MNAEIIPDPDNVPVRHVSGVVSSIMNGQTIVMTLVTDRALVRADGTMEPDLITAARLRFDLETARRIRDQIDAHLSGLTTKGPDDAKPN